MLSVSVEETMKIVIVLFVVAVAAVSVLAVDNAGNADAEIEFISVKNLTEYLQTSQSNLNLVPLKRDLSNLIQVRYLLGNRVNGRQYCN